MPKSLLIEFKVTISREITDERTRISNYKIFGLTKFYYISKTIFLKIENNFF